LIASQLQTARFPGLPGVESRLVSRGASHCAPTSPLKRWTGNSLTDLQAVRGDGNCGKGRLFLNPTKTISFHEARDESRKRMTEDVVGQRYDSEKNQLPYGGAVDINGRIVWAVTEEEDKATRERINRAFGKK
jgi:hypothetical protein